MRGEQAGQQLGGGVGRLAEACEVDWRHRSQQVDFLHVVVAASMMAAVIHDLGEAPRTRAMCEQERRGAHVSLLACDLWGREGGGKAPR